MGVAVVLAAAVVAVVAGIGQELAGDVVGGLLPARGSDLVEPFEGVLVQPGLVVVDPHAGGDVHGADEHHAFGDAGVVDRALDLLGDADELAAGVGGGGGGDRGVPYGGALQGWASGVPGGRGPAPA